VLTHVTTRLLSHSNPFINPSVPLPLPSLALPSPYLDDPLRQGHCIRLNQLWVDGGPHPAAAHQDFSLTGVSEPVDQVGLGAGVSSPGSMQNSNSTCQG
jgi:hypothetical protein